MSPRIPICAMIASLSMSACTSPSANLPRDAQLNSPSPSGFAAHSEPTAQYPDGVADRVAPLGYS